MKRKLFAISAGLAVFTMVAGTSVSAAGLEPMSKEQLKSLSTEQAETRVLELTQRVNEIKSLDLSQLPKEERKELKNEMREIKKEMDFLNNKLTLSVGAIIIIVLVLIIIL